MTYDLRNKGTITLDLLDDVHSNLVDPGLDYLVTFLVTKNQAEIFSRVVWHGESMFSSFDVGVISKAIHTPTGYVSLKICEDLPSNALVQEQVDPTSNDHPAVWDLVVTDMQDRDKEGRRKYNTPLQPFNGRNALVDAYQEGLDLVVYLRQKIEEEKWFKDRLTEAYGMCVAHLDAGHQEFSELEKFLAFTIVGPGDTK